MSGALLVELSMAAKAAIRRRRESRGMSQQDAATASSISLSSWGQVESGDKTALRTKTAQAMSRALGWTPDSIERLARGEEPVEAVPERPAVYGSTPDGRGLSDRELELIDAAVKAALERIRGEQ